MPAPRYHGRAAFDLAVVAAIAAVLRTEWDSDGALALAARVASKDDQTLARTYDDFALAVAGVLGAGGSEAEVAGYLRREEERLLGVARSTGQMRWTIAQTAWRLVRGIPLAPRG
jgi:hypothetical protein